MAVSLCEKITSSKCEYPLQCKDFNFVFNITNHKEKKTSRDTYVNKHNFLEILNFLFYDL